MRPLLIAFAPAFISIAASIPKKNPKISRMRQFWAVEVLVNCILLSRF
jgi:hypothetical protein